MSIETKIVSRKEYNELAEKNKALAVKAIELEIEKKKLQEARAVQSQYDKQEATKAKANDPNAAATQYYNARAQEQYKLAVAAADATRKKNTTIGEYVPDTSPIPCLYLVSRDYYIAYTPAYGVLIVKGFNNSYQVFRLKTKKEVRTYLERNDDTFNDLTRADFNTIVSNKPTWEMLEKVYRVPVYMNFLDNILKRMNRDTAQPIW